MKRISIFLVLFFGYFHSSAQLANGGLENWRTYSAGFPPTQLEAPNAWFGIDSIVYAYGPIAMITPKRLLFKDTISHGGFFAAKIISRDLGGQIGIAPGFLLNANPEVDLATLDFNDPLASISYAGGTVVNQRITQLTAWVKYEPRGNDVAVASVQALLSGAGAGGADSVVGNGDLYISSTANYTQITVPIIYVNPTIVPDKMLISFLSSDITGENGTMPQDSSALYVDDIALSGTNSINELQSKTDIVSIYPNPSNGILNVSSHNNNILIWKAYNINGQQVATKETKGNAIIDLRNLPNGLYLFEVIDPKEMTIQRGKFNVLK